MRGCSFFAEAAGRFFSRGTAVCALSSHALCNTRAGSTLESLLGGCWTVSVCFFCFFFCLARLADEYGRAEKEIRQHSFQDAGTSFAKTNTSYSVVND